jgi:nitroreductase
MEKVPPICQGNSKRTLAAEKKVSAIYHRRAVRAYTAESVNRMTIERLIEAAIQAPSAMDSEPWAFVVFEGKARLREFSDAIKSELSKSEEASNRPAIQSIFSDPAFNVFYGVPVLILICATSAESQAAEVCCLAAQNLMLAAHDSGLATCPIGFARKWLSSPSTRRRRRRFGNGF